MREILFRGKTENGKWVEGLYQYYNWVNSITREFIETTHHILPIGYQDAFKVLPETVGQYTGLCDQSGKKIFEGDICQIKGISYIDETPFVIEWNNDWSGWYWRNLDFGSATDSFTHSIAKLSKVIGNIHDNPELLEGE